MADRRLIISGTREALSAEDREIVAGYVLRYAARSEAVGVGDCQTGVDALVRELCPDAIVFEAAWGALGNRAGPERNGRLVAWAEEARDGGTLLAFPGPQSVGTWDCHRRAQAATLSTLIKRVGR